MFLRRRSNTHCRISNILLETVVAKMFEYDQAMALIEETCNSMPTVSVGYPESTGVERQRTCNIR
jgi:hypothetical protein